MLDEVDEKLSNAYKKGYKKIEFEYGFNKNINKYELNLYHSNIKFLVDVTNAIANNLNSNLSNTWKINTLK